MDDDKTPLDKSDRPHAHFETPHEVIVDPALSEEQKIDALDSLEQDARQLAIASAEGMTDGETTGLKEVLHAKDVMKLPPIEIAYEVVLQDLQLKLAGSESDATKAEVQQAIAALHSIRASHS